MKHKTFLLVTIILAGYFANAQQSSLTFTPHWLPQAQFAGYYVARDKGFYNDEGLRVNIKHPSASVNATQMLENKMADVVSLFLVTALKSRANNLKLVNIAQQSQHSALMFVTHKKSGIEQLKQLNGKRIAIWKSGFDEVPKALMQTNNYNVEWVPILSSINLFMAGGVDAMTVMWYNEYDQIINAGKNPDELNTFRFSDYGYNIPEDGLYCLESTYLQRKNNLRKFVKATINGWEYARKHPEEALDVVLKEMKKAHVPTNYTHQKWMLQCILELNLPGNKNVEKGELSETDFHKTLNLLKNGSYINTNITFDKFYKPVLK
ncbi:MAG TPA: ABC transporter substrate-binding protein [Prolixibacteraceae bacterium]|nr:ABC transporter substrate-binding protein [Prolixibacteraceae bacterium]